MGKGLQRGTSDSDWMYSWRRRSRRPLGTRGCGYAWHTEGRSIRYTLQTKRQYGIGQAHFVAWQVKESVLNWATQVGIDEKRVFSSPGHENSQVGSNSALAVAYASTRDHQRAQRFVQAGKPYIRPQNTIGLNIYIAALWIDHIFQVRRAGTPDRSQDRQFQ